MSSDGLHDTACHDLALLFLEDEKHTDGDVARLAQAIQDAVEDWFFTFEHERRAARRANE